MVIDALWWISEIEPLMKIALFDPSPEFRLRAIVENQMAEREQRHAKIVQSMGCLQLFRIN